MDREPSHVLNQVSHLHEGLWDRIDIGVVVVIEEGYVHAEEEGENCGEKFEICKDLSYRPSLL
jgi:hypothetical protein